MKAVILNCVSIICFTALAIIFKHWWIVLFAMLFMFRETYQETKQTGESEDNNDNPRKD